MLAVKRKEIIKEIIKEKKSVIVSELAERFTVTEETIRRDLKALEDDGLVTRTYGGAFIQDGVINDVDMSLRETYLIEGKQQIAQICKELIHNGDSVFVDGSTTALQIARAIKDMRISVMTNSLKASACLSTGENIRLITIGGMLDRQSMCFSGTLTLDAMTQYYVDTAFISCRSLSLEHGVTDSLEQSAAVRKMMASRAGKTYIVADYTKFGKTSFVKICSFKEIAGIITDKPLSEEWHKMAEQAGITIYDKPV